MGDNQETRNLKVLFNSARKDFLTALSFYEKSSLQETHDLLGNVFKYFQIIDRALFENNRVVQINNSFDELVISDLDSIDLYGNRLVKTVNNILVNSNYTCDELLVAGEELKATIANYNVLINSFRTFSTIDRNKKTAIDLVLKILNLTQILNNDFLNFLKVVNERKKSLRDDSVKVSKLLLILTTVEKELRTNSSFSYRTEMIEAYNYLFNELKKIENLALSRIVDSKSSKRIQMLASSIENIVKYVQYEMKINELTQQLILHLNMYRNERLDFESTLTDIEVVSEMPDLKNSVIDKALNLLQLVQEYELSQNLLN